MVTGCELPSLASAALAIVNGAAANATSAVSRKRRRSASTELGIASDRLSQRSERFTHLGYEELRLFPRSEVPAFGRLVVVDQFDVRVLRPAFRGRVYLVRERGYGDGDLDAAYVEEPARRGMHVVPIKA